MTAARSLGWLRVVPVLLLLGWVGTAAGVSAAPGGGVDTVVYENPERTLQTTITRSLWTVGPMADENAHPDEQDPEPFTETVGRDLVDCSDAAFLCAQSWGWTLAVPRSGLTRGARWSRDGVAFGVHECLKGDGQRCQVALVSAVCARDAGKGHCRRLAGHQRPGSRVGYVLYFLFNQDVGITAMGAGNRIARSAAGRRAVATQEILISDQGLLGPQW